MTKTTSRKRRTREEMNADLEATERVRPWHDLNGEDPVSSPEPEPEPEPEPVPEEEIAIPTKPVEARVAMRVYLAACSHKWDQMQGFKSYATTKNLGPLSMREWNEAYQAYLNREVK